MTEEQLLSLVIFALFVGVCFTGIDTIDRYRKYKKELDVRKSDTETNEYMRLSKKVWIRELIICILSGLFILGCFVYQIFKIIKRI